MQKKIYVCFNGDCCHQSLAEETFQELSRIIEENGLDSFDSQVRIKLYRSNCLDVCKNGPIILVQPERSYYQHIPVNNLSDWLLNYVVQSSPDTRFLLEK